MLFEHGVESNHRGFMPKQTVYLFETDERSASPEEFNSIDEAIAAIERRAYNYAKVGTQPSMTIAEFLDRHQNWKPNIRRG
jgi:hypothetical protein